LQFQQLEDRAMLASTTINTSEDNGSITLATDTKLLIPGNQVVVSSDIGDGPYGATTGDYDFFKVLVHAGQGISAQLQTVTISSSLQGEVLFYNSNGQLLDANGGITVNGVQTVDASLQEQPGIGGYYYIAVGSIETTGTFITNPANPFDSSSGPGVQSTGNYTLTISAFPYTLTNPVAQDITTSINEQPLGAASLAIPIVPSATSPGSVTDDGVLLPETLRVITPPTNGKVNVNLTTGVITYTPNYSRIVNQYFPAKYWGPDSFTYQITDADGLVSNVATANITVVHTPTAPLIQTVPVTLFEDTPRTVNVLANATDANDPILGNPLGPTGQAITPSGVIIPGSRLVDPVTIQTAPTNGTATADPTTGVITYTPNKGYLGKDSLTYVVTDSAGSVSRVATLSLLVNPAPPTAVNDTVTTPENTPVTFNELANDTAVEATIDPTTVAVVTQPTHGTVTVNPVTGEMTYTPALNYFGPDSLTYTVKDTNGLTSNVATVAITVTFFDYPPVANDDAASTNPNTPVDVNVLANDTDQNNDIDPTTVAIASQPANGTVSVNPTTGIVTYTPNTDFTGTDTFTYTVRTTGGPSPSGPGAISNTATVTITVHDFPIAVDDTVSTDENTSVTIPVLANDTDGDATIVPSSVTITTQPAHGTATVDPTTGNVLYTPTTNYSGPDSFQYTIQDTFGVTSKPGTVNITVVFVPQPPVAVSQVASTAENTAVTTDVAADDFDVNPNGMVIPSTVAITTAPVHGTAVANGDGSITYTPNPGFTGADQVAYTIQNTYGITSNPGTLSIRVGPPVTVAGNVYVDVNNNGIIDPNEVGVAGVTITLTKTDGPVTFSLTTTTGSDGTYSFSEVPGVTILPGGVYTITETSPAAYVDGKDTPGNFPATVTQDQFSNITLPAGAAATGFNFGELGLNAAFVFSHLNVTAFFASSESTLNGLDLVKGPFYMAFNGGSQISVSASAVSSGQGTVQLSLLNQNMQPLTSAAANAGQTLTQLSHDFSQTQSYILEISGTDPNVSVSTAVQSTAPATPPTWHNLTNPLDVNGDGVVSPLDSLIVINALNSQGPGSLGTAPNAAHSFLDVEGNNRLTSLDALVVINQLNAQAAASAAAVVAAPSVAIASPSVALSTPAGADAADSYNVTLADVAFAVATAQSQGQAASPAVVVAGTTSTSATAASGSSTANNATLPAGTNLGSSVRRPTVQQQAADTVFGQWND
jgi:hypothetical protein